MSLNRRITVYHTHIEVFPYEQGEVKSLEDSYSVFDPVFYKMTPIAYHVTNNTLYLPRGTNIPSLERLFRTTAIYSRNHDPVKAIKIKPTIEPKSKIQEEAVEFLCSDGRFTRGLEFSQLSLNLEPGDGKTIAAILAIATKYKCKAIVIVHQTKLKNQWKAEFLKASDISEDKIVDITGSDMMLKAIEGKKVKGDIYLVNHQTIHQFGNRYGWDMVSKFFKEIEVGVKIYDEAHKYFSNIMMIDFFSNTEKTFYLTATFTRNDYKEKMMFKRAFGNTYRFGEETSNYAEKRKHIIYYYVTFHSEPDPLLVGQMYNKYSISSYKYIDYALHQDENNTLLKVLGIIMEQVENLAGKIIILSPTIESTEEVAEYIRYNFDKSVSVINSSRTREENEEATKSDVICSTIKSLGTGIDIRGLRVLINMEPFTSEPNMIQLKGRLREFSKTDDTFMFDLVDLGLKDIGVMGDKRKAVMKKHAKEIRNVKLS